MSPWSRLVSLPHLTSLPFDLHFFDIVVYLTFLAIDTGHDWASPSADSSPSLSPLPLHPNNPVALKNGNQMLEWYHHGIYGKNGKWTCCKGAGRHSMGCTQATKYSGMDEKKTQRLLQAEKIHEEALRRRQRGAVVSMQFTSDHPIEREAMRTTRSRSLDIQHILSTIRDVAKKRSSSASGESEGRGWVRV